MKSSPLRRLLNSRIRALKAVKHNHPDPMVNLSDKLWIESCIANLREALKAA